MSFHNAVELLFKQLLYEAHPLLLYPDVDKTNYPLESLLSDNVADELIGTDGYAGTIDRIDEASADLQKVYCIICDIENNNGDKKKSCRVIVEISVNTETYFEKEYFPGGREKLLYVMKGTINESKFEIEEITYLDTFHKPRLEKLMVTR